MFVVLRQTPGRVTWSRERLRHLCARGGHCVSPPGGTGRRTGRNGCGGGVFSERPPSAWQATFRTYGPAARHRRPPRRWHFLHRPDAAPDYNEKIVTRSTQPDRAYFFTPTNRRWLRANGSWLRAKRPWLRANGCWLLAPPAGGAAALRRPSLRFRSPACRGRARQFGDGTRDRIQKHAQAPGGTAPLRW